MKLQKKKKKVNLVVIFLVVALAFAVIWGACELIRHLSSYGNGATINTQPEEEEPVPEETPEDTAPAENLIDGIPANPHDPNDFAEKNGFIVYTGTETWHTGVDVSAHQGEINWEKAAADGIQFAMIRLGYRGYTEGEIGLDPYFLRNIEGAQAAGLDVGVYFFSQAITKDEAVEEAKFVLNWIEGYEPDYPIFFDWEDIEADARTDGMDMLTLTGCVDAFCATIEDAGYRAGVYFNQRFGYQELNLLSLRKYMFWLAEYNPAPTFTYDFEIWQYSCDGRVDGISGPVDLNMSFEIPDTSEE